MIEPIEHIDLTRCAPNGQPCLRCNGTHNVDSQGRRTFITSLSWGIDEDDETT